MGLTSRDIIVAFQIVPNHDNPNTSTWIITSGYHRSFSGTGPIAGNFIESADKLEDLLKNWA